MASVAHSWKAAGKLRHRLKNSGGSYLSSHDLREVLGIGARTDCELESIAGQVTHRKLKPRPNRYIRYHRGQGMV